MATFIEQHAHEILAILSCSDHMMIHRHAPDICHADAMAGYLSNQGTRLFDHSRCRPPPGDDLRAYAEHLGPWRKFVSPRCPAGDMCVASQPGAWRMTLHLGTRSEGDTSAIRRRWLRLVLRRWPR